MARMEVGRSGPIEPLLLITKTSYLARMMDAAPPSDDVASPRAPPPPPGDVGDEFQMPPPGEPPAVLSLMERTVSQCTIQISLSLVTTAMPAWVDAHTDGFGMVRHGFVPARLSSPRAELASYV